MWPDDDTLATLTRAATEQYDACTIDVHYFQCTEVEERIIHSGDIDAYRAWCRESMVRLCCN